ncbi:MAG: ThuA domain-containing protein, partial [Isosphaeraceae bacterium]
LTNLGHDFSVRFIFANDNDKTDLPGLDAIDEADVLLISVRRKPLKAAQLDKIQQFVRSGKPVVGIRTASHAFHLRTGQPPEGTASWPGLDAEVWGGSYTNHHANDLKSQIIAIDSAKDHPVLMGVKVPFHQGGSLYKVNPLQPGAVPLLNGQAEGVGLEPVAYTFTRNDGGRSFYTSLGHKADFENPAFIRLLVNSLLWAAGRDVPKDFQIPRSPLMKPGDWKAMTWQKADQPWFSNLADVANRPLWARCLVPVDNAANPIAIQAAGNVQVFCNGIAANKAANSQWIIPQNAIEPGELNLIVLRWATGSDPKGPCPLLIHNGQMQSLGPVWEINSSSAEGLAALPLPARFAAATDLISR